MLDDKALDPEIAAAAPKGIDHLCDACRAHFDAVLALLDALDVRYEVDHRLVRGLDYYTRTTFEFFVAGNESQQGASAAVGATTGWSSCSAVVPRRASGSASASTGPCCR